MKYAALVLGLLLAGGGCARGPKPAVVRDTMSTRERQEAIGRSAIPGARGVTRALEAADSASARVKRLDSTQP